jgi:hypothetical protein
MPELETKGRRRIRLVMPRRGPAAPRAYRLATSIRVPWIVGASGLLLLAVASVLLLGRSTGGTVAVSRPVIDDQAVMTQEAAQSVRRSLNEGVDDLAEAAAFVGGLNALSAGAPDQATLRSTLESLASTHDRYVSLYVLRTDGGVLLSLGTQPRPDLLVTGPPFDRPGMEVAFGADGRPVIAQFAPIPGSAGGGLALVGLYDPTFLQFPLGGFGPGNEWIVDQHGRVVVTAPPGSSVPPIPANSLNEAQGRGIAGDTDATVVGNEFLLGFAPVQGAGPAGSTGWVVMSSRRVAELPLPQFEARRQGLVFGLALLTLTLLVFAWLYVVLIAPILSVQREAERLAFGNLAEGVNVVRYDEIGLIARSLERIRILLIRRRVQPVPPQEE